MPNIDFIDLLSEVQPKAKTAPVATLVRAIRDAAIEFCERTEVWRYRPAGVQIDAGVPEVTLTLPEGTVMAKILRASLDGRPLTLTSEELLEQKHPQWRQRPSKPSACFRVSGTVIAIAPMPIATYSNSLDLTVALKPIRTATSMDADILDDYYRGIVEGALSYVLSEEGESWSNPVAAAQHRVMFENKMLDAYAKGKQDNTSKVRVMAYGGL